MYLLRICIVVSIVSRVFFFLRFVLVFRCCHGSCACISLRCQLPVLHVWNIFFFACFSIPLIRSVLECFVYMCFFSLITLSFVFWFLRFHAVVLELCARGRYTCCYRPDIVHFCQYNYTLIHAHTHTLTTTFSHTHSNVLSPW